MAEDNSTPDTTDGTKDRKFPVIGCALVALLIIALFAVIFFYGQFAASPFGESNSVGP